MFHRKVYKKKFLRYRLAFNSRRFNKNVVLPQPAITRSKKSLFLAKRFYSFILDKVGMRKFLLKFINQKRFMKKRKKWLWKYFHERFFFRVFYNRRRKYWPVAFSNYVKKDFTKVVKGKFYFRKREKEIFFRKLFFKEGRKKIKGRRSFLRLRKKYS